MFLECKLCTSRFKSLRSLKVHMNIYDESKAYQCTLCDKKFSSTNQDLTYQVTQAINHTHVMFAHNRTHPIQVFITTRKLFMLLHSHTYFKDI